MIYRAAKLKADTFDFSRTWKTSMKRQPRACILRTIELLRLEKPFKDHQVKLALFYSKKPVRKEKEATTPQSTATSIAGNQVMCSALCRELWRIPSLPSSITGVISVQSRLELSMGFATAVSCGEIQSLTLWRWSARDIKSHRTARVAAVTWCDHRHCLSHTPVEVA